MIKQKIFITGATGFLGSSLTHELTKNSVKVYSFKGDLSDFSQVFESIKKISPDIIYHLGAVVDLSRDFDVANNTIDINIKGTLNVLESIRTFPIKRFIYTSTEEIYGNNKIPYKETMLPEPPSPYAVSKVASESFIKMYANELKFSAIIFRIGTIYGPGQPLNRFFPQIISQALSGQEIKLNSGKKKRDYIFIDDTISALVKAKKISMKNNVEILNLGGGKMYSLKVIVDKIMKISNSKSKLQWNSFPDRISEADEWLMDLQKTKKVLSWTPTTNINKGLKSLVTFQKRQ